jgi:hypothetical protein
VIRFGSLYSDLRTSHNSKIQLKKGSKDFLKDCYFHLKIELLNCERNPENLKIENLCRNFIKQSRMAGVYFSITPSHVFSDPCCQADNFSCDLMVLEFGLKSLGDSCKAASCFEVTLTRYNPSKVCKSNCRYRTLSKEECA